MNERGLSMEACTNGCNEQVLQKTGGGAEEKERFDLMRLKDKRPLKQPTSFIEVQCT